MGFADLNLDGEHELYVMYKYKGSFYEMNGASMPYYALRDSL